MKRKRIEAWASVWPDGVVKIHGEKVCADGYAAPHVRVVRLVPANPAMEALNRRGLRLLKEHYEANDPYVDGYPTERARAAEHRKTCADCAAFEKYQRSQRRKK